MRFIALIFNFFTSFLVFWFLTIVLATTYFSLFVKGHQIPGHPEVYSSAGGAIIFGFIFGPLIGVLGSIGSTVILRKKKPKSLYWIFGLEILLIATFITLLIIAG